MIYDCKYIWGEDGADTLEELRVTIVDYIGDHFDNGPGWVVKRNDGKCLEVKVHVSLSNPY